MNPPEETSSVPPTPSEESPSRDLATVTPETGQVLLRSRDVQALSRSFRRLSEVQQALLDQMTDLEESRSRQWILPVTALGALTLGVGLTFVGVGWMKQQEEPMVLPNVVVNPTPITIEADPGALHEDTALALVAEIKAMRESQEVDKEWVTELNEKLLNREISTVEVLKKLADIQEKNAASVALITPRVAPAPSVGPKPAAFDLQSSTTSENPSSPFGYVDDPWLGILNGLLALDGYTNYRFQKATQIEGRPELLDVTLFHWGEDGLLKSVVRAKRVEFNLQKSTFSLSIRFFEGTRTHEGLNLPLPRTGSKIYLPDVNVSAWGRHFPALLSKATLSNAKVDLPQKTVTPLQDAQDIRKKLDDLISIRRAFGYYRLTRLEGATTDGLSGIQIAWYDVSGRLVKTIEADSMEIKLHEQGWVELLLKDGAFLEGGVKRPFYEDKFRLHLPRQPLDQWRALGLPLTQVGN